MCRDTEQLLRFLVSHHVVLGDVWCERCSQPCCVDLPRFSFSAASASSRHILSANNYITESGKCHVICMRFFGFWFFAIV